MRILLCVGLACAALLVALFAFSSRGADRAPEEAVRGEAASAASAPTDSSDDLAAGPAHGPQLDSADIARAAERAAVEPLDAASAKVPPGRIRIEAQFVEVPRMDARRPFVPRVVEDQTVVCRVEVVPDRGDARLLATERATSKAGTVAFEFADPGARPLRVELALAGRELERERRGRHVFRRPDERACVGWVIPVLSRRYTVAVAQDLLGNPIAGLEVELDWGHREGDETSTEPRAKLVTDAGGRCALPPTRDETWRVSVEHPNWIPLGYGPYPADSDPAHAQELRWLFARAASLRVDGLEAVSAVRGQLPEYLREAHTMSVLGDEPLARKGDAKFERVRAKMSEPPAVGISLHDAELQRLGIDAWTSRDVESRYAWMLDSEAYGAQRVPAGLRLVARVERLFVADDAIAIQRQGERRFRGVVGGESWSWFVLDPGESELALELAPAKADAEPSPELELDALSNWEPPPEREPLAFVVVPKFDSAVAPRCVISMRPSASVASSSSGSIVRGWRAKDGTYQFKLPDAGRWDLFVEVRPPHACLQVVHGVDVATGRIEVPIALAAPARVRVTHVDCADKRNDVRIQWSLDPERSAPRIGNGRYTISEPLREPARAAATADDASDDEDELAESGERWSSGSAKRVLASSTDLSLPSGVAVVFDVKGLHESGHVYAPLRFGPVALEGGAYELAIADSLTGGIDLVVATTEEAARISHVWLTDASGTYVSFLAGGMDVWVRSAWIGGIGTTTLRGVAVGDATVVVNRHDGSATRHTVRVERGATTRLEIGAR